MCVCFLVFLREEDREKPQESFVRELEVEEEAALRGGGGRGERAAPTEASEVERGREGLDKVGVAS